jgi:CRP/FNR family transcriptional regulator, cyclic AMP receptor protein
VRVARRLVASGDNSDTGATVACVVVSSTVMGGFASALSDADRSALFARGHRRRYERNTRVFCEGDPSDFVLVILAGRVKLAVTTEDGDESLLGVRGPGDLVGELAALDSNNRLATAIAIEPLTVQSLTAEEFRAFIAEHPSAALELTLMLIGRLREADRRRAEFGVHDATPRVAHLLAELAAEHQPPEHGPTPVQLSQQEIGELIGASRESVARALSALRDQQLLTTGRRSVTVIDLDGLRSFNG